MFLRTEKKTFFNVLRTGKNCFNVLRTEKTVLMFLRAEKRKITDSTVVTIGK